MESHDELASVSLYQYGLSKYIIMFMPIIVAFPFVVSFCAYRKNILDKEGIAKMCKYLLGYKEQDKSFFICSCLTKGVARCFAIQYTRLTKMLLRRYSNGHVIFHSKFVGS